MSGERQFEMLEKPELSVADVDALLELQKKIITEEILESFVRPGLDSMRETVEVLAFVHDEQKACKHLDNQSRERRQDG